MWSSGDILGASPSIICACPSIIGEHGLFGRYNGCGRSETLWVHLRVSFVRVDGYGQVTASIDGGKGGLSLARQGVCRERLF